MHFDARLGIVPTNEMAERIHGRRAPKLAVDPMQEIEIERCRYPLRVVIGRQKHICIFEAIDADQQHRTRAQRRCHAAQQIDGGRHQQISDR